MYVLYFVKSKREISFFRCTLKAVERDKGKKGKITKKKKKKSKASKKGKKKKEKDLTPDRTTEVRKEQFQ